MGVLVIIRPTEIDWAAIAALIVALTIASNNLLIRKLPKHQTVAQTLLLTNLAGVPASLGLAIWEGREWDWSPLITAAGSSGFILIYAAICVVTYRSAESNKIASAEYSGLLGAVRTMRVDAEANGPQWSSKGDSRITRLGRVLRKLHLDELPQLVNVAKGEMVLVGPRPERPEFVALLTEVIPGYQRRLIVKPGITGMAQINLPPDTDLRSVERKQILDLYHIDNADFWLDKRMVLLTAFRVMSISNDRLTKFMGLDRKQLVEHLPAESTGSTSTPLSTLMAETTANQSPQPEMTLHEQEEDTEARDFHAGWDSDSETWDDDTHDSWEGMSLSENSPR